MNKKNKCKKYSSLFSGFLTYFITGSSLIWLYYIDYYDFQLDNKYILPIIITFSNLSNLAVKFLNKYFKIKTYITFSYSFLLISHLLLFLSTGKNKLKIKLIEIFALILYGISIGIIQFPILKNCQMYFQTKSQTISFICFLFYNFRLFFFFIIQFIININKKNQESILKTYIISYLILFCITLNTSFDYRNEYLPEEKKTNLRNYISINESSYYSNKNFNSNNPSFRVSNKTIEVSLIEDPQKSSGNSSSELSDKIKSVLVYNDLIFNKTKIIYKIFSTMNFFLIIFLNVVIFYKTFYFISVINQQNKAKFLLFICFERIIFSFCINLIHIKIVYLIILITELILRFLDKSKLIFTLFSSIIFSLQSVSISPLILKIYGTDISHIISSFVIFISVSSVWIKIIINLLYKNHFFEDNISKIIEAGFFILCLLCIYGIKFDPFDYGEITKKSENNKEQQNDIELSEVLCDKK